MLIAVSIELKKTTSIIKQVLDPITEGNVKVVRYTAGGNNELEIKIKRPSPFLMLVFKKSNH